MNVSRRLVFIAGLLPAAFVAACDGTTTTTPPISQDATDVGLIASGLDAALSKIIEIPGISQPDVSKLDGYLLTIENDAKSIAVATSVPAPSTLTEIDTGAKAILAIASPYLPTGSSLLPLLNAAVDLAAGLIAAASGSAAGASLNSAPRRGAYSRAQARAILAAASS